MLWYSDSLAQELPRADNKDDAVDKGERVPKSGRKGCYCDILDPARLVACVTLETAVEPASRLWNRSAEKSGKVESQGRGITKK